ncbi:MAG: tetratricopeptide repeat protein [Myxococcota bacterium]
MGRIDTTDDRAQLLEQAARARSKRQRRRAIALYRQVLVSERHSIEIHEKLAPLLAETGQHFDAWNSYRLIAQSALREGRDDRAIAVYREATRAVPQEIQSWQGLARLLARRGDTDGAVEALVEGSHQFTGHFLRPQAIHLLRRARSISPWHFETVLELARHLGRSDQSVEARMLLDGLLERCEPWRRSRVRVAQLSVEPGPRALWAWFVSWWSGDEPEEPEPTADVFPLLALAPSADDADLDQRMSSDEAGTASAAS